MEFGKGMQQYMKMVERQALEQYRKVCKSALKHCVENSPEFIKPGWKVSVNESSNTAEETEDAQRDAIKEGEDVIANITLFDQVTITNSTPGAVSVENGWKDGSKAGSIIEKSCLQVETELKKGM